MVRRSHSISIILMLVICLIPYITAIQALQITQPPRVTIAPVPPEVTVPSEPITWGEAPSAFATITPVIDGAITSGFTYDGVPRAYEWAEAVKIEFVLNITKGETIEAHNATLYLMNDYTNLYLALVVRAEEYSPGDLVHFNFDNDNDGELETGDDQLAMYGASNIFQDLHFTAEGEPEWDTEQNGVGAAQWYHPFITEEPVYTVKPVAFASITTPPTAANKAAYQMTQPPVSMPANIQLPKLQPPTTLTPVTQVRYPEFQGTWIFEVAHPLRSEDWGFDLNVRYGDVIGLSLAYWDLEETGRGGAGGFPAFFQWEEMFAYQIAGTPDPAEADVIIDWIEVVQTVQDPENSVPLARGKTTAVRVFLDILPSGNPRNATVFLYARDPETLSTLPGPLVASASFPMSSQRDKIHHSANFLLPTSWVDRDHLEFQIYFTSVAKYDSSDTPETNYYNNWAIYRVTFHKLRVLNVYEVLINTGTAEEPHLPDEDKVTQSEERMRLIFPMDFNFIRLDWEVMGQTYSGNFDADYGIVLAKLNEIVGQIALAWLAEYIITRETPSYPLPDLIYGHYPSPVWGEYLGMSSPTWSGNPGFVAAGSSGWNTMAHECNHILDRSADGTWGRHAGPEYGPRNCHAKGPDPEWPYANDNINEFGLDLTVWPPEVINPGTPDLMSYCRLWDFPQQWTSPYRHQHLIEAFNASSEVPADTRMEIAAKSAGGSEPSGFSNNALQQVTTQVLQVSGWVEQGPKGAMDTILQVETPDILQLREYLQRFPWLKELVGDVAQPVSQPQKVQPGILPYELVAIGPDGKELYSLAYFAHFIDPEGGEVKRVYFTKYIPMDKRLGKGGRIELRVEGKMVATRNISPGVPVVQVLTPQGGDQWHLKEKTQIRWKATDPERDPLFYTVQYSPNGGKFWIPLATGLKNTTLSVDPARIPGSTKAGAFVRVLATDGFNTGTGQNERPFYVPGKAPVVHIDAPVVGQTFGYGDIISMKAHGFDLEDGRLKDSAFTWEFEGGHLGNGSAIDVVRLGPGTHIITLTGTDSTGMEGTARIKVHISGEKIIPALQVEPLVRAGAGLSVHAIVNPSRIDPGDSAVVQVAIQNKGVEPATAVELEVQLPPGLSLASESTRVKWVVIQPAETVEGEFKIIGRENGVHPIQLDVISSNLRPAEARVYLGVGEDIPLKLIPIQIEPVEVITPETTKPPETTRPSETELPETSPEETTTAPLEVITETITQSKPAVSGFEVVPALLAIHFVLLIRRRRRRR